MVRYRVSCRIGVLALVCLIALLPGCSWTRMPPAPSYDAEQPIPIIVGVEVPESHAYDSQVITLLKEMNVFQFVIWPYDAKTPVDGVLTLSIKGSWKNSRTVTSAIVVGLSLGLLGPVVGPKMTGNHDVTASLTQSDSTVVEYQFHVETELTRGLATGKDVVQFEANGLQTKKIATELANRFNSNRDKIAAGTPPLDPAEQ